MRVQIHGPQETDLPRSSPESAGDFRDADAYRAVLDFWFAQTEPRQWFALDPQFDARIRDRFTGVLVQAAAAELSAWRSSAAGRLAEIIVLDQFSRNVYRGTPAAFAQDPMALVLAQEAVAGGALQQLDPQQRNFLLLPYMHSESRRIHAVAESLYREYVPEHLDHELRHRAVIERFGRYPHRNSVLGRVSTVAEAEFLVQSGAGF
jgi:uncharacterized protein (DUF924 family)